MCLAYSFYFVNYLIASLEIWKDIYCEQILSYSGRISDASLAVTTYEIWLMWTHWENLEETGWIWVSNQFVQPNNIE